MKFRKKPVIIEAKLYLKSTKEEIMHWIRENNGQVVTPITDLNVLYIKTLEGVMQARLKDWIIKGTKGEFYPCKHDIFLQSYEKV